MAAFVTSTNPLDRLFSLATKLFLLIPTFKALVRLVVGRLPLLFPLRCSAMVTGVLRLLLPRARLLLLWSLMAFPAMFILVLVRQPIRLGNFLLTRLATSRFV